MNPAFGLVLLFGSWMQPLHLLPWMSWHSEFLAFFSVGWFAVVELQLKRKSGNRYLYFPRAALVPLALAVLVLIQHTCGLIPFFGDALVICFYLVLCSIAIGLGYMWFLRSMQADSAKGDNSLLDQLAIVVLTGAVASALIALVQSLDVWDSIDWIFRPGSSRRPGANIGQPNQLATLLIMGTVSLGFLYKMKRVSQSLAILLVLTLALGIAISESRAGLLSLFFVGAWWIAKRASIGFKFNAISVWLGCVVFTLLVWAWPIFITFFQSGVPNGIQLDVVTSRPSGLRFIIWPQLVEAVMQRPWLGWGIRQVSVAHNSVLSHYQHGEPYTYAHNLILELAIGFGLPFTILSLVLVGYWGWKRVKMTRALVPWYCIALLIPFFIHSMLEFPFSYAYLLVPAMIAVGALEASLAPEQKFRVKLATAGMGLAAVAVTMAFTVVEYVSIEEDFRVARFEALRIGKTPTQYNRPQIHLLTQLDAMLVATRAVPSPEMQPSEIELLRKAAMRFPWTAIQNRYALALALNGNPEEASRQLKVMRAMFGEKTYQGIRAAWEELGKETYPQLLNFEIP